MHTIKEQQHLQDKKRKMKFSIATSVLAISAGASLLDSTISLTSTAEAFAFAPKTRTAPAPAPATAKMTKTLLRMSTPSSAEDEVAKLRAAAAKAREEATKLAKELGKDDLDVGGSSTSTTTVMTVEKKSPEEVAAAIRAVDFSGDSASSQVETLDRLRKEGYLSLYKSATEEAGSGDLRSYPVTLSMLEQRSGLTAETLGIGAEEVSLDDFKYGTLYVAGGCSIIGVASLALLPENIGATVCYLAALIPILWLGVGSTAPAAIAGLIAAVKGSKDDVSKEDRVCRHEAAHFLLGYLAGLPIAAYTTTEQNTARVEFHYSKDGPATSKRELTESEVNALTCVAMSGAVAEAMKFGKAVGVNSDLIELQSIFRQSEKFLGAEKQQDLTRWGALTSYRLLKANENKLDALVDAFRQQKPISDCVSLLESS